MAILKTPEMLGLRPVPMVHEIGEVQELTFVWDTAVAGQALSAGDFVQLMQIPGGAVITDIRLGASATLGNTTVAVGIANAAATANLATTYIAAGTLTDTTPVRANATIMAAVPLDAPTVDENIVTLAIAAEGEATNKIYVTVQYRAGRYGK